MPGAPFLLLAVVATGLPQSSNQEWAKGIPFTTSWPDAIKQARETGKMLFIYNGTPKAGQ